MTVAREEMVSKMITRFGFENIKTVKFAETASNENFPDDHVECVFHALYGE